MRNNDVGPHGRTFLRAVFQLSAGLLFAFAVLTAQAQPTNQPVLSAPASIAATVPATARVARGIPTPSQTIAPRKSNPSPSIPPTQPPGLQPQRVKVPRIASVDEYTVALYRFDSQDGNLVPDATGVYTGTLHGNAVITSTGLYNGALYVDGSGSYFRTGYLGDLPRGTLEAFVDFSTACFDQGIYWGISAGGEYGSQQNVLRAALTQGLMFGIFANGEWYWVDSGINACRYLAVKSAEVWPYETWRFHHVALTWGERGMEIWVDGVLHGVGVANPTPPNNTYEYKCNPQMQIGQDPWPPNDLYPVCKTPVIGKPAPGSYKGGLPAYSTFLIGCDSSGSCFRGRIDELRISNIQRTFEWTVVPTSTPTPSQTPDRITGEYTVDSATLGLYHLSDGGPYNWSTKNEVTQLYDAGLRGNAVIVPGGRFGNAVSLDGNASYVHTGSLGNPGTGAVEAWVNLTGALSSFTVIHAGGSLGSNVNRLFLGATFYPTSHLVFGMTYPGEDPYFPPWAFVESNVDPTRLVGSWHHIAGTWGSRGYEFWLDGQLCATRSFISGMPNPIETFLIGCHSTGGCMQGIVDEVRISNVQRSYSTSWLGLAPSAFTATRALPTGTPRALAPRADSFQLFIPLVIGAPQSIPCGPYQPH